MNKNIVYHKKYLLGTNRKILPNFEGFGASKYSSYKRQQ